MSFWDNFPAHRLMAEASIWSSDFTDLAGEFKRVDPFIDLYHFDVSDAHFVPGLLFFPDLIAALRPLTQKMFHVHLMVDQPLNLVDDFAQAGADLITIHCENGPLAAGAIKKIQDLKLHAGLAVGLESQTESILPYLEQIDLILLMGTPIGVKGVGLSRLATTRIRQVSKLIYENGFAGKIKIEADGGIRQNTVPELRLAGADLVVMGSLLFKSNNLEQTFNWLHTLKCENEAKHSY